jgi:hypothetical protein
LKYYNVDSDKGRFLPRTIDINKIVWSNKKDDKCYKIIGLKDELDDNHPNKVEEWMIDDDVIFMIYVYYQVNPDPSIRIVTAVAYSGLPIDSDENLADEWMGNGGWFNNQLKERDRLKRARRANRSEDIDEAVEE